jgi:flavoprotein
MIEAVLERLDKVRKSGKGYLACCPVHDDKSPSMSVTEKDGRVLCHCFACGANGAQVAEAIGLPVTALFEGEYIKTSMSRKDRENLEMDRMIVLVAQNQEKLSYKDWKRVRLAKERIKSLEELESKAS